MTLVRSHNHKNGSGADGDDTDIKTHGKADQEDSSDNHLKLGPQSPATFFVDFFFVDGRASVVSVFLGEHLGSSVSHAHDSHVLHETRGSGEQFTSVVSKHHKGVDQGSSNDREDHVLGEFEPHDIIISQGNNQNVLGVSSHGQSGSNVGGSGQGKKVGKGVGNLVANAKIDNNSGEDKDDRVVHDSSRSNGRHGHNLGRSLPVNGIVQGVTKFVE